MGYTYLDKITIKLLMLEKLTKWIAMKHWLKSNVDKKTNPLPWMFPKTRSQRCERSRWSQGLWFWNWQKEQFEQSLLEQPLLLQLQLFELPSYVARTSMSSARLLFSCWAESPNWTHSLHYLYYFCWQHLYIILILEKHMQMEQYI